MGLDILTPAGQLTLEQERAAVSIFEAARPRWKFVTTPKDKPAVVDGLLMRDGQIMAVVEAKCRMQSLDVFFGPFRGEWLVTYEKVAKAREIAKALCVPLIGFLYIEPDNALLVQQITDELGNRAVNIRKEVTETRETVNGGRILRDNAFIDVKKAKVYR